MRTPIKDWITPEIFNHQRVFRFANNFGASVIRGRCTYGGSEGLFELAVIKFNSDDNEDWKIDYDTGITDDVIGYCSEAKIEELLSQIEKLEVK